jgi:hypothetical protein
MLHRGGALRPWIVRPDGAPTWTRDDWARAATYEALFTARGAREDERRRLVECAVWRAKLPEMRYESAVEERLKELMRI